MKYEVEALDTYERLNISDNELKKIPKVGEKWEVSKERLDVLLGQNNYKEVFVKSVKKIKEQQKENVEVKEKTKKVATKKQINSRK